MTEREGERERARFGSRYTVHGAKNCRQKSKGVLCRRRQRGRDREGDREGKVRFTVHGAGCRKLQTEK